MNEQTMQKMQVRLKAALQNPRVQTLVTQDLMLVFSRLGLREKARHYVKLIMSSLGDSEDLEGTEWGIHSALRQANLFEKLEEGLHDRAATVFSQVQPYFKAGEKIIDWGAGDGQVTNLVYQIISKNTLGYDVCDYRTPGIDAPVMLFDGKRLPVVNGFFDAGLMTNVAHHEENNALILKELARVIRPKGRLVVLETVPVKDEPDEFERTFVSDYVYNRLFHEADIPVPGTYETEEGWVRRFNEVGFKLEWFDNVPNPYPLGYDQPLIRDWHTRLVLRRMD
jgi:SAM-dependent methyltransferase